MENKYVSISHKEDMYNGGIHFVDVIQAETGNYYAIDTALLHDRLGNGALVKYYESMAFPCDSHGEWTSRSPVAENRNYITPGTEIDMGVCSQIEFMHSELIKQVVREDVIKVEQEKVKEKEDRLVEESKQKLRGINGVGNVISKGKLDELARKHTPAFIDGLINLGKTRFGWTTNELLDGLNKVTALDMTKRDLSKDPNVVFQVEKFFYNDSFNTLATLAIQGKEDDPMFMGKFAETQLTPTQLHSLYEVAVKNLAKSNKLCTASLPLAMREVAQEYVREHGGSLKRESYQQYISFGMSKMPENFRPIKNTIRCKPSGGIWACEYRPNVDGDHSDWEEFCRRESFMLDKLKEGLVFTISENARVLTIDTPEDVNNMYEKYGMSIFLGKQMTTLDFEWMETEYDVINITKNGQLAMDAKGIMDPKCFNAAQYDVATTIVFNPNVMENIEPFYNNDPMYNQNFGKDEIGDDEVGDESI